jgi:hypothetical protein
MFLNLLLLLFSFSAFSSEIFFRPLKDWEMRKNLFGSKYALILEEKGEAKHVVMFKLLPKEMRTSEVDDELKRVISNKEISKNNPWSKIKIHKIENLSWSSNTKGRLAEVEFVQGQLPHTALVGIYPQGKEYYFIFVTIESIEYPAVRKYLLPYLKSLNLQ